MRSLLIALIVISTAAAAQTPDVPVGSLVLVERRGNRDFVGNLTRLTRDSVHVTIASGAPRAFGMSEIRRLRLGTGRTSAAGAWQGTKVGTRWGATGALVLAAIIVREGESTGTPGQIGAIVGFTGLGAVSGAVWGAVIGAFVKAEDWETVFPAPRARLTMKPMADRSIGIGLRAAF